MADWAPDRADLTDLALALWRPSMATPAHRAMLPISASGTGTAGGVVLKLRLQATARDLRAAGAAAVRVLPDGGGQCCGLQGTRIQCGYCGKSLNFLSLAWIFLIWSKPGTKDKDVPLAAAPVEMKQRRQMGGTSTSSLQWRVLPPNATTVPAATAAVVILVASIPFP